MWCPGRSRKTHCVGSFFLGGSPMSIRTQQTKLKLLADDPGVPLRIALANAEILPDGPGRGNNFYYDPHTKEYTGELPFLKGWCGRIHGVAKVLHMDFIHTESGMPCFVGHYDNYYDLRQRLPFSLAQFDLLFPAHKRKKRNFVFDQGVYGDDSFSGIERRGDYVTTWESGYEKNGWNTSAPITEFVINRIRNRRNDLRTWRFQIQEAPWAKRPGWRRIIVRATNPSGSIIDVSVLCSHPTMKAADAVKLIFHRWLQENDFKNLDKHFGMMQMTSRKAEGYDKAADTLVDRNIECTAYKKARAIHAKAKKSHAKLLLDRKHAGNALSAVNAKATALAVELDSLDKNIAQPLPPEIALKISEFKDALAKCRWGATTLRKKLKSWTPTSS